jgi:hypothetical protein
VAVYLDTNVLYGWTTFTELSRLAISIVAGQLNQQLVLPELVADEAEAQLGRELQSAVDSYEAAEHALQDLFPVEYTHVEPYPDVQGRLAVWRTLRDEVFRVAPMQPNDAVEGLRREIHGVPPAKPRRGRKPGAGARDVALWLTLVRDHRQRGQESHFVTTNTDFLDGDQLKHLLQQDLEGAPPLHVYRSAEEFVAQLGDADDDRPVDLDALKARAYDAVRDGLRNSFVVADAVFSETADLRIRSQVLDGTPTRVVKTRHYERGEEAVALVTAEWDLVVRCAYQQVDRGEPDAWYAAPDVVVSGPVQVYVPERASMNEPAQYIAARLTAAGSVYVMSTGGLLLSGALAGGDRDP